MQKRFLLCLLLYSLYGFGQNKLEVFFDFNQDVPNAASKIKIEQWLSGNKDAEIIKVFGFCDSVDDSKYNKDLAQRRINSMLSIFKNNNIKIAEKIEMKPFGKDFKYSGIQSENRKVEVFYNLPKEQKAKENQVAQAKIAVAKNEKEIKKGEEEEEIEFGLSDLDALVASEKETLVGKFKKAKVGDIVRISNINFYLNSEKVMVQSIPLLNELLQILLDNPKMRIEIHGHICCNADTNDTKLSYRRALIVLKYLTGHGIDVSRLDYKGYGSSDPIYRVPERNEKERVANRRVEILIIAK